MTSPVRRRLAALAVAPLVALTLVACGGDADDSDASPSNTANAADSQKSDSSGTDDASTADASDDAPAARLPTGDDVDATEFADAVRSGMESVTTAELAMQVDFDGDGGTGTGVLDATDDRLAVDLELQGKDEDDTSRVIKIDDAVYVQDTEDSDEITWMKLSPSAGAAFNYWSLLQPFELLELTLEHAETVEHVGAEEVGGADTQHYRLSVAPEAIGDLFAGLDPTGEGPQPTAVELEVWLDGDGRPVQTRIGIRDDKEAVSVTTQLSSFGGPDPVEPPPEDQVTDLGDLYDQQPSSAPRQEPGTVSPESD